MRKSNNAKDAILDLLFHRRMLVVDILSSCKTAEQAANIEYNLIIALDPPFNMRTFLDGKFYLADKQPYQETVDTHWTLACSYETCKMTFSSSFEKMLHVDLGHSPHLSPRSVITVAEYMHVSIMDGRLPNGNSAEKAKTLGDVFLSYWKVPQFQNSVSEIRNRMCYGRDVFNGCQFSVIHGCFRVSNH